MRAAPGGPATNAAITHALLGGRPSADDRPRRGPWAARSCSATWNSSASSSSTSPREPAYETPLTTVLVNAVQCNPHHRQSAAITIVRLNKARLPGMRHGETCPQLILTDGFHLDGDSATAPKPASQTGTKICLDGGSWKAGTEELACLLSCAICSERFEVPGQSLRCRSPPSGGSRNRGVPQIAITRGANPILGWDRARRFEIEIATIDAVDTTGRGRCAARRVLLPLPADGANSKRRLRAGGRYRHPFVQRIWDPGLDRLRNAGAY